MDSPPLSLTQPPRPPSSPSPLVIKEPRERDREGNTLPTSGRILRDRSDRDPDRDSVKNDRDIRDDVSPPCSQSSDHPGAPTSPLQLTPVLVESQIMRQWVFNLERSRNYRMSRSLINLLGNQNTNVRVETECHIDNYELKMNVLRAQEPNNFEGILTICNKFKCFGKQNTFAVLRLLWDGAQKVCNLKLNA